LDRFSLKTERNLQNRNFGAGRLVLETGRSNRSFLDQTAFPPARRKKMAHDPESKIERVLRQAFQVDLNDRETVLEILERIFGMVPSGCKHGDEWGRFFGGWQFNNARRCKMNPKRIADLKTRSQLEPLYDQLIVNIGTSLAKGVLGDGAGIERLFYLENKYLPGLLQLASQEVTPALQSLSLQYAIRVFLARTRDEQEDFDAQLKSDLLRLMDTLALSEECESLAVQVYARLGYSVPEKLTTALEHLLDEKRNNLESIDNNLAALTKKRRLLSQEIESLEASCGDLVGALTFEH
jgi:hypothetical protein